MKISLAIVILAMIGLTQSISQFDFNACRISNCNAEEINCLSDESGCLNYFAIMRTWYLLNNIVFRPVVTVKIGIVAGEVAKTQLQESIRTI